MLEYNDNIGVDEAGRGPLLGSVVACAVYINKIDDDIFEMVNDSKKLSEKKRELIYDKLISSDKKTILVAIDGKSTGGKTTLGKYL